MSYISALIALAATILGVRGHTWNDRSMSHRWWQRITVAGWAAITLALLSAGVSLKEAHLAASREQELRQRQLASARLAFQELHEALGILTQPFVFLASGDCRTDDLVKLADCALAGPFIAHLWNVKIYDPPEPLFLPSQRSWATYIAQAANQGDEALKNVTLQFHSDLPPDVLASIDSIRNSGELVGMMSLSSLLTMNEAQHRDVNSITIGLALSGFKDDYVPFFELVKRLEQSARSTPVH